MTAQALRDVLDGIGALDEAGLRQSLDDLALPALPLPSLVHWALRKCMLRVVRDSVPYASTTLRGDLARTLGVEPSVSASGARVTVALGGVSATVSSGRDVYDLIARWVQHTGDPRVPYHLGGIGTVLASEEHRTRAIACGLPVRAASPRGSAYCADAVGAAFRELAELGFELPEPPESSWELAAAEPARMLAVALDAANAGVALPIATDAMRPTRDHLHEGALRSLLWDLSRLVPIANVGITGDWSRTVFRWTCGGVVRELELRPNALASLPVLVAAIDADLARTSAELGLVAFSFPSMTVAGDDRYRVVAVPPGHAAALARAGMPLMVGPRDPAAAIASRFAPQAPRALAAEDICGAERLAVFDLPSDVDDEPIDDDAILARLCEITAGGLRIVAATDRSVTFDIRGVAHQAKRVACTDEEDFVDLEPVVRALNRVLKKAGARDKFLVLASRPDNGSRRVQIAFGDTALAGRLRSAGF